MKKEIDEEKKAIKEARKARFKELWNNRQTHAWIVLGIWVSLIAGTYIVLGILSLFLTYDDNNDIKVQNKKLSIIEQLNNLNYSDYSFEYTIDNNGNIYSYNGTKKDGIEVGYYESDNGIIKYEINQGIIYKVNNKEEKEENTEIINATDGYYLNFVNIENLLRYYYSAKKTEDNKVIFDLDSGSAKYYFEFIIDENDNIEHIIMQIEDIKYDLIYKDINNSSKDTK